MSASRRGGKRVAGGAGGALRGFREFVMRGNVIDLAVAVVIGGTFAAVVKAFTDEIVNPVLAAFGGAKVGGFGFCVDAASDCTSQSATFLDFGAVITALISFLITMAVVYFFFVLPMNKARELARIVPKSAETPDEVLLLREIRDLLAREAQSAATAQGPPAVPTS
jgi:large conductance mechanosensitive channel